MLPAFKETVEEPFVAGLVKVVFATETLALGINMPARTVVLEKLVKYNGETHADITPGEYTQLTGRAGRRGIDVEGHAVVVWQPGLDPAGGGRSGLAPDLPAAVARSRPTYNMAVNLVGSRRARSGPDAAGAVVRPVPGRPLGGRAGPVARPQHRGDRRALGQTACDRGDFEAYARLRAEIGAVEAEASRERSADRRAEATQVLLDLDAGRHHPGAGRARTRAGRW